MRAHRSRTCGGLTRLLGIGSISLCLLPWLHGCASAPVPEAPQLIRQKPPAQYLNRTLVPAFSGRTNADLLNYVDDLRASLGQCNADKDSILEWSKGD